MRERPQIVQAADFTGWNMTVLQLIGKGPKFTIRCGNCSGTFAARVPMISYPTLGCPYCGALNELGLVVS